MFGSSGGEVEGQQVQEDANFCYSNCPRIYPHPELQQEQQQQKTSEQKNRVPQLRQPVPPEYQSEAGRRLYPDRLRPCYLFIQLTRQHCRALRNFIVSNSSKLAVVKGNYCGIANKVFNLNTDALHPTLAIGLLRFASTDQAYRFVIDEHKLAGGDGLFLGGRFDVWNLTLLRPDKSVAPNPAQPGKLLNSMSTFHFVHVKSLALPPDSGLDETSEEAMQEASAASDEARARLERSLDTVQQHGGRLVVKTTAMARIRGRPFHNPSGEPRKIVYMSQWPGLHQFWQWLDSPQGAQFNADLKEFAGGSYESLLFTVCLDFNDLP